MRTLLLSGAAVGLLGLLLMVLLRANVHRAERALGRQLAAQLEPVTAALAAGRPPDPTVLLRLAERRETRISLFRALSRANCVELFPQAYRTTPLLAESVLTTWLMHSHELGAPPAEMELIGTFERTVGQPPSPGKFLVFKFRAAPGHWAEQRGWMVGISGPWPGRDTEMTWSELEPLSSATAEEHLDRLLKPRGGTTTTVPT